MIPVKMFFVFLNCNLHDMDIWDKKKRSEVMSKIRSKNTKPEILLRKALFAKGYRYRINYKKLPGKPDIVLPKYKTAIFVHGCFWHGHEKKNCTDSHIPKTNTAYWAEKIRKNKERDIKNIIQIHGIGWKTLVIWDCEIQQKNNIELIVEKIISVMQEHTRQSKTISVKIYEEIDGNIMMVAEDTDVYQTD